MTTPIRCYDFEHGYDAHVGGPCCFQPISGVSNFKNMHEHPVYIEIRDSFKNGQWPEKYCTVCQNIEKLDTVGSVSKRQGLLHRLETSNSNSLHQLTIDTGRLCNIQCRSCHPVLSSSWIKEYRQMPNDIRNFNVDPEIKVYPHKTYDYQTEDLSNVRFVQFLGGEPVYNPSGLAILEKLYQETNGDCEISFTSNATIPMDFTKNSWLGKFKQIYLVLSLDAIDHAAEYIRTGSRWATIEKNIEYYKTLPNVSLSYHPTFSVLNLFEVVKLFNWAEQKNIWRVSETTWVEQPDYLSYQILTPEEKYQAVDYLKSNTLDFLAAKVEQSNFSPELRKNFFIFMDHTTRYHGMDWQYCLPELYSLLNTL